MPMACLETDLDVIFSSSEFGEEILAVLNNYTDKPIAGIFDDEHIDAQNGEGITVLIPETTFTCASSKLQDIAEGQILTVRNTDYKVRMWKHDGSGVTVIYLEDAC